ncbi:Diacylglycerol kinase [compost metagenome]
MRVLLLTNPQAGLKGSACPCERFLPTMVAWGWTVKTQPTPPGLLKATAYQAAQDGFDAVIVAGGDGTLHHVANGLAGSRTALGILPCGTANDLARTLGLPLEPDAALASLRDARPRSIDLGCLNGHYFLNVAALGVSADVSTSVTPAQKRRLGQWAYTWNAVRRLFMPQRLALEFKTPQSTHRLEVYQLSIGNGPSFGGGWRISEEATVHDRLLDVVAIEPMGLMALLDRLLFRRGGMAERISTHSFRLPECRIELKGPVPLNLDGEPFTLLPPLEFQVVPDALQVLMPSEKPAPETGTGEKESWRVPR